MLMFGYFHHIRNANDVGLYIYVGIISVYISKYPSDLLEGEYYDGVIPGGSFSCLTPEQQAVLSTPVSLTDNHLASGTTTDNSLL